MNDTFNTLDIIPGKIEIGRLKRLFFGARFHQPFNNGNALYLTSQYSFRLLRNFGPNLDYQLDIASVKQPLTVFVGENDELFDAQGFLPLFHELSSDTKIVIVPEVGHITLTTSLTGISAIAETLSNV